MPFPAFATFTSLARERLRLRPVAPGDAPAITPLVSDWEIARPTGRIPHPYPEGGAERWISDIRTCQACGSALAIERKEDGRLIGCITLETDPSGTPPPWVTGSGGSGGGRATPPKRRLPSPVTPSWPWGWTGSRPSSSPTTPLRSGCWRRRASSERGGEQEMLLFALPKSRDG
ncbi:MAG: GNAT family N-acetyltransferase [Candidatus Tectomicrobia bacterium]|uniref:GNAT family N-acetyltransferase n=1 Tax=Tectimicrobiota bacterium TaxID=2528274 RepID=A0A933E7B9_UNCTE|nr:GNAT family N-acetyltransferase [Candidatus Tectomicrobia bacterium]MBI2177785.1 GNAT family N-acetyltransferase [Candidatus Tectomicrobia bacterium]MBI4251272.1 GNAT family N-acetyltransferase [Candidatus Tectomicrobia bacterium]